MGYDICWGPFVLHCGEDGGGRSLKIYRHRESDFPKALSLLLPILAQMFDLRQAFLEITFSLWKPQRGRATPSREATVEIHDVRTYLINMKMQKSALSRRANAVHIVRHPCGDLKILR